MTVQLTSLDAHDAVKSVKTARHAEIMAVLPMLPDGMAAHEIAAAVHHPKQWTMPRITELRKAGKIEPTPGPDPKKPLRRLDPETGQTGIVWRRVMPQGWQATFDWGAR